MDRYPGYTSEYPNPRGFVVVYPSSLTSWVLSGLVPNITAGIHIHRGTTCSDAAAVGGHLWEPSSEPDPWAVATYTANSAGHSNYGVIVDAGAPIDGHAVVVHGAGLEDTATRVGCGVLRAVPMAVMRPFGDDAKPAEGPSNQGGDGQGNEGEGGLSRRIDSQDSPVSMYSSFPFFGRIATTQKSNSGASRRTACSQDSDCGAGKQCYRAGQPEASCIDEGALGSTAPETPTCSQRRRAPRGRCAWSAGSACSLTRPSAAR